MRKRQLPVDHPSALLLRRLRKRIWRQRMWMLTRRNAVPDDIFEKIVALIRVSTPYTGMIMSTRESKRMRERGLALGISQISGGSRTSVGGYAEEELPDDNSAQFDTSDRRSLDEIVEWCLKGE